MKTLDIKPFLVILALVTACSWVTFIIASPVEMDLPVTPDSLRDKSIFTKPTPLIPKAAPADKQAKETDKDKESRPEQWDPEEAPTFFGEKVQAKESIIYVVDRSSSMWLTMNAFTSGDGTVLMNPSRFEVVKAELKKSILNLSKNYTFNIILYHECVSSWKGLRVPATDANKAEAMQFIEALMPEGWTNTGLACATALKDKENATVLLLSDGVPNFLDCDQKLIGSYDEHLILIRDANTQNATIHCFGMGLTPDARTFLKQIASQNNGNFIEIQ